MHIHVCATIYLQVYELNFNIRNRNKFIIKINRCTHHYSKGIKPQATKVKQILKGDLDS